MLCSDPDSCISQEVQSSMQPMLRHQNTIFSMEIQFYAENPYINVLLGRATKWF